MGIVPTRRNASLLMDHMNSRKITPPIPSTKQRNVEHSFMKETADLEKDAISYIGPKINKPRR